MLDIVVLVSGGGTNLQTLIDRIEDGSITNGRIVKVISSRRDAFALERAKKHGHTHRRRSARRLCGCGPL